MAGAILDGEAADGAGGGLRCAFPVTGRDSPATLAGHEVSRAKRSHSRRKQADEPGSGPLHQTLCGTGRQERNPEGASQRPTVPQPALQAGGRHRVTRHIGFRNEKGIEIETLGVPLLRRGGLSRHETVARTLPRTCSGATASPPRGPSAGYGRPSRPYGLPSLTRNAGFNKPSGRRPNAGA